jgi:small-conductance mechanosensitive channel
VIVLKHQKKLIMMTSSLAELLQDYFNLGQLESEIGASAIIFAVAVIVGWAVYSIFRKYLSRWAKKTKTKIDDEILRNIKAPIILLAFLLGLYYGLEPLTFLKPYSEVLSAIFTVAQILLATFIVIRVLNVLTSWFAERARREKRVSEHILFVLKQVIRAIVYMFAFFAVLAAFHIDLSGVAVGLGISGIAIALALQTVLGDVFSAFSIYFDRPFEVGDSIVVGDYSGTVKRIGIKSTRLQLLQGEELIISNRQLTTTSIRNFKKLKKRRVAFKLSVAANTSLEKLKKIPAMIAEIIRNVELAEFDRVHFVEFGDFSLNFEAVYYMKTSNYTKYMDVRQEINFAIMEAFEKEGIVMPFPTQTIFLKEGEHS